MNGGAMERRIWVAIIAVSGILNGCAVLTIDVDVYKGSLINEEHVQMHQLLALATAAKPMLVQLRDSIEWPGEEKPPEKTKDWYEPNYVVPPKHPVPPKKSHWWCMYVKISCPDEENQYKFFEKRLAIRVNEVLGLYEDLDKSGEKRERAWIDNRSGLDRLIKNYWKSNTVNHAGRGNMADQVEHELIDVLVEFSSKVLFLANHEGLASPPGTAGLLMGGAEKLTRGIFGDELTDLSFYGSFRGELEKNQKQRYVRVLQAVGNSILFSANELRERDKHRQYGVGKVKAEVNAVNVTHTTNPKAVMDDLLEELKAEKDIVDQKVSDAKIRKTLLEKELADLIATQKPALTIKQTTAETAVTTAQANLTNYQSTTKTLKALHQVLITEGLDKKIPQAWGAKIPSVGIVECFLKITSASVPACVGQWTGLSPGGSADSIEQSIQKEESIKWPTLTEEQKQNYNNAIDYVKATEALQSFQNYRQQIGSVSMKADDLLSDFINYIVVLEKKRVSDELGLIAQVEQANKMQTDYQKDLVSANNRVETIKRELSSIKGLIAAHPIDSKEIENAIQEIGKLTDNVRSHVDAKGNSMSAKEIYEELGELLKQEEEKAGSGNKQKFIDAQAVLESRMPPSSMPPLDPEKYKSPQEVMDQVIALLRHRQMEAVERFGKDSEQDKKAIEALESAYQHRAGMIYIRPSSAYLRTSFPSTALQDDPNLAWDNMLLQQGVRNLPFSSELRDILDPSVPRDRLLTSELDKQYWQNINRVRVSGTGFTNQVVAKDDVGNWYVKQYYGDTEDIVKSAKNLALFNLGTNLPIDLAGELKAATKPKTKPAGDSEGEAPAGGEAAAKLKDDTKIQPGADSPPLQRLLEKHRNAYQAKTTEVSTRLEGLHTKNGANTVHNQIVKAWKNIDELKGNADPMDALKAALDIAVQEWDEAAITLRKKPEQDPGQLILKDLRALSRLDQSLSIKIQEIGKEAGNTESDPLASIKTKATAEVSRVVGRLVLDILNDRQRTLDSYEQAIMFIGDAINPKGSP